MSHSSIGRLYTESFSYLCSQKREIAFGALVLGINTACINATKCRILSDEMDEANVG